MAEKRKPLTREQIQDACYQYVTDAVTYLEAELSPDRVLATKYYRGDKFGNEETGRSQFIATDVRDTTLAVLPSLVRMFLPTSGHVIEYQPRPKSLGDLTLRIQQADQATEFVNGVVLDQDNNGFLELHGAFKDALVRKLGTIKYWWEDASTYRDYTARGCDVNQFEQLVTDPDVEIQKVTEQSVDGITYRDVEYRHWRKEGYARFVCTPPEEVLISRDARTRDVATFIGHRTEKTKSELLAMGVSEADIDQHGGPSTEVQQSLEEVARRGGVSHVVKAATEAEVKNLWVEGYPYLDLDGDGIAELCRVRLLGADFYLVGDPEPVDERPFAFFCPDPEPHVLIGESLADRVMDLQKMKSSLIRAAADGLSKSIFPDTYYMEGILDRQAMESTAVGKSIAVRDGVDPNIAVREFAHEWKGNDALAFIGYLDTAKQQRTGPLPATLDPDSLQSTPEVGVKATVQAASEQLELIARVFAATGMKQLGKGLLKLLVENQPRSRIARLRGQYVEVDPHAWDADMDVSVHVALGTQEKLGVLAATAADQFQILSQFGLAQPLVTIAQYRNTRAKMLELQGVPDVDRYYNNVPPDWAPAPQPQAPDPNLLIAQAEMTKAQAKLQKDQADFQIAQVKAQQEMAQLRADLASKEAELLLKREEMHLTDERERDKAEADVAVKIAVANAQFSSHITAAEIDAQIETQKLDVERERIAADVATAKGGNGDDPKPKKGKG